MRKRWIVALVLVLLLSVGSVSAVTRVQKLSEDRFLITLKKLKDLAPAEYQGSVAMRADRVRMV